MASRVKHTHKRCGRILRRSLLRWASPGVRAASSRVSNVEPDCNRRFALPLPLRGRRSGEGGWLGDGSLLAAWGDGGGFGGTDREGRVSLGLARLEGTPPDVKGINVNGGKDALHVASFPDHGKVGGMLAVGERVYGWLNAQDGK